MKELELKDIHEMHDKSYTRGQVIREKGADDLIFYVVTQWDDNLLADTELSYRGEFNILRKAGRQIMSDLKSNPVQVDFDPKDESRQDGADLLDGLYRSDDRVNTSIEAYWNASNEAVICGVGAWYLYTEYASLKSGETEQVIKRKPIYEANNNLFWDPNAKLLDKSDAKFCSWLHSYLPEAYVELVKELTGEDIGMSESSFAYPQQSYVFPWVAEDKQVYVAEFYYRELVKDKVYKLVDPFGQETTIKNSEFEEQIDDLVDAGFEIISEKDVKTWQVTKYIASGERILESSVIAGEFIPVIPMYGERFFVEGQEWYEGVTRLAKDPQRLRNFQMSYLADIASRSPRPKPVFTPEQIQGHEWMYEQTGADNQLPYYLVNATTLNGEPLPLNIAAMPEQTVPQSLMISMEMTRQAVEDVANPGIPQDIADPDLSGKAVIALQNRMDMQSMVYQENIKHAKRRDGEVYASMACSIHDTPRNALLTLPDGQRKRVQTMELVMDDQTGEFKSINDISCMEFDVYSDIGPSYTTQKQQTQEKLGEMISALPDGDPIKNILVLKSLKLMDGVDFDDVREYANNQLILQGIKEPETDEEKAMLEQAQQAQGEQPNPAMVMADAEMLKGQADMAEQQNRQAEIQLNAAKVKHDEYRVLLEEQKQAADIGKTKADTMKSIADAEKISGETMGQQIANIQQLSPQPSA